MAEYILTERKSKTYRSRRTSLLSDYKKLYRFDQESVSWMADYFLGKTVETRGGALSNEQKICLFLRFCADPGFQIGVGEDIGVHQSTVSRTIHEMAKIIASKGNEWIKFPSSADEVKTAQKKWQQKNCFPFALGAIDCTHIRIKKPHAHGDEYICRKGFHSINVQATCDADEIFTNVDVSWPGSVHDSRILRCSGVKTVMENITNDALLLGDEGYGITPWLMTPFRNPATEEEKVYNKIFTRERVIIERCFGQIKQRFPILQYKLRLSLEIVPYVIVSCYILHNIAKFLNDDFDYDDDDIVEDEDELWRLEAEEGSSRVNLAGKNKRKAIANLLN